jgi:hypothetical protein
LEEAERAGDGLFAGVVDLDCDEDDLGVGDSMGENVYVEENFPPPPTALELLFEGVLRKSEVECSSPVVMYSTEAAVEGREPADNWFAEVDDAVDGRTEAALEPGRAGAGDV